MKAENALTMFCMATVLLIVALVGLTAKDMNILNTPSIDGQAYGSSFPIVGSCILPPGFEQKYQSDRECRMGTLNDCDNYCSSGGRNTCVALSQGRCSFIGSMRSDNANNIVRAAPYSSVPGGFPTV